MLFRSEQIAVRWLIDYPRNPFRSYSAQTKIAPDKKLGNPRPCQRPGFEEQPNSPRRVKNRSFELRRISALSITHQTFFGVALYRAKPLIEGLERLNLISHCFRPALQRLGTWGNLLIDRFPQARNPGLQFGGTQLAADNTGQQSRTVRFNQ